ncbi:MAG: hypothetical protein KA004_03770 [Verrucomicrobiales bacterium]|nr:hypothetical protein [Verrucomicrobiales bacterium]
MFRVHFAILLLLACFAAQPATAQQPDYRRTEYVVCSGGPALRKFEEYRVKDDRHDRYWGNFITAARIRMQQLRGIHGDQLNLTWLIYRPSYVTRQTEDRTRRSPEIEYVCDLNLIQAAAAKVNARIVWFSSTQEFVSFLNRHTSLKMCGFEYFGHSNKFCFLFDYSAELLGCSICYLHEKHLGVLKRGIFTRDAHVQSWGCHTGESMSAAWKRATGHGMLGATGKTDYAAISDGKTLPALSEGRWTE